MSVRRPFPRSKETSSRVTLEGYSDLDLARLACQGEKEAWQALYLRYFDFLFWVAREKLKLPQELQGRGKQGLKGKVITVEQFVNDVYIVMWEKKKFCSYTGPAPFQWWYNAVAATIYSDLCRQEQKHYPPGMQVPLEEEDDE